MVTKRECVARVVVGLTVVALAAGTALAGRPLRRPAARQFPQRQQQQQQQQQVSPAQYVQQQQQPTQQQQFSPAQFPPVPAPPWPDAAAPRRAAGPIAPSPAAPSRPAAPVQPSVTTLLPPEAPVAPRQPVEPPIRYGRSVITFDNQSGEHAQVRLVGPTRAAVEVANNHQGSIRNVAAGHYVIRVRYGTPDNYRYCEGDAFDVEESGNHYSAISITLHPVVNGNYGTRPISAAEFAVSGR